MERINLIKNLNKKVKRCMKQKILATLDPQINFLPAGEEKGEHVLPPLKYDYTGLEPSISGMIMEIHHTKHHQGYINNLKAAVAKVRSRNQSLLWHWYFIALVYRVIEMVVWHLVTNILDRHK